MVTNPKDALAAATSLVRSQNLFAENYVAKEGDRPGIWIVTGPDTTAKKTRKVVPHGPYSVDIVGETCDCKAFGHRGVCPHIEFAQDWARGRFSTRLGEAIQKGLWGVSDGKGRFLSTGDGLIYAYKSEGFASATAVAKRRVHGKLIAEKIPVAAAMGSGRYAGLLIVRMSKEECQPVWFGVKAGEGELRAPQGAPVRLDSIVGLGHGRPQAVRPHRFPEMAR